MHHVDFSSWPRDQEASFVVYESRTTQAQKQAYTLAAVVAAIVFVFALVIYGVVEPEKTDMGKDMNLRNISRKETKPEAKPDAPKAEAAPAATPAPAAPAEAPKAETPAEAPAK